MSGFSDMLSYLRKREGFSQQDLADRIGVSRSAIGMYESGSREPSFETLEAIADTFNVNMSTLLGTPDETAAAPAPGNSRLDQFNALFDRLSDEQQALILAAIKGFLSGV